MNTRFVIRGFLIALPATLIGLTVGLALLIAQTPIGQPPDPTPLPPTILAPRGELPAGPVGLEEWAQYRGEPYVWAGSGFLIRLGDGEIVGVTAAHSVALGDPARPLEQIGLRVAGQADFVAEFDTLRGRPGKPLTPGDFTIDYVLLQATQSVDSSFVLTPDPRGAPQPGERVALFSGLGDGRGGQRVLEGTVQSVGDKAVWVLMDKLFNPSLMSGSPFVSQHTGQVVGMAVAATLRRNRVLIGVHPIGSIVRQVETATEFPKIGEYRR
ncbi:MAG: serine protease [Anaerolineae bacterium]